MDGLMWWSSIHFAIEQYKKDPSGFARLTFHSHILNALQQMKHGCVMPLHYIYYYYCSADQPISMCTQDPFPAETKTYNLYKLPSCFTKIDDYELKVNRQNFLNNKTAAALLCGYSTLTTTIIYPRSTGYCFTAASTRKQMFWQPLHCPLPVT